MEGGPPYFCGFTLLKKSHPMDVARTAVSVLGLEDKETNNNSPAANMRKTIRIFAKTPTAIAAFFRARKGKNIIPPKKNCLFLKIFFICVLVKFLERKS